MTIEDHDAILVKELRGCHLAELLKDIWTTCMHELTLSHDAHTRYEVMRLLGANTLTLILRNSAHVFKLAPRL